MQDTTKRKHVNIYYTIGYNIKEYVISAITADREKFDCCGWFVWTKQQLDSSNDDDGFCFIACISSYMSSEDKLKHKPCWSNIEKDETEDSWIKNHIYCVCFVI